MKTSVHPLKLYLEILAVCTYASSKRAYLINIINNMQGGYQKIDFDFGEKTEVLYSCSLQWYNHFYIFGGKERNRQVSMVNGKRLERKGDLSFNFQSGGCTVINQQTVVLCFGVYDVEKDVCRKSNNPIGPFTKLPNSNFNHLETRIASIDGNK